MRDTLLLMAEAHGLSDDELWESSNPRFGVVRAVMVDEGFAGALEDLNCDYREVTLDLHRRGARSESRAHSLAAH